MAVKNMFSSKDISEPLRRRVELAIAVSQERLLSTHVDHALKLIQLLGEKVPFENALGIYTRLLRLTDDEARVITTRALAILGERAARSEDWPELVSASDVREAESAGKGSFFKNMRHRLRGRVKDDMRRWVEMMAARTEVAILDTHVANAHDFVELLAKEQPAAESIELYLEALEVRDSIAEVTYYLTLAKLAEEQLPPIPTDGSPMVRPQPAPATGEGIAVEGLDRG
jgi:hypothetical protein